MGSSSLINSCTHIQWMAHYPCVWLKHTHSVHSSHTSNSHECTTFNREARLLLTCRYMQVTVYCRYHKSCYPTSDHAMILEVHAIKISSPYYQAVLEKDITHLLPLALYVTTLVLYTQRYRLVIFSSIAL